MMKKILSFLIILGAITFINIDLFAYTFNGSYDFSSIDLDQSLSELNGASLNDLFDYDYFEHLYLAELPNGTRSKFELNNGVVVFKQYVKEYVLLASDFDKYNTTFSNVDLIGISADLKLPDIKQLQGSIQGLIYIENFGPEIADGTFNDVNNINKFFTTAGDDIWLVIQKGLYTSQIQGQNDLAGTKIYYELSTPIINTNIEQSLLFYNLENINIDLLNYYFAVWLLNTFNLPVGDLWTYAYNAGYDIGNLQGYSDGYNDGLFDYHTGNSYGQYDYTLSEPYDQATQANISLLSVFSLIIGVVMSMLGFIINIEMFGISIASILGTLAIGVSIIWLLKLIRG